jgi:hypothetical protein
MNHRTFFASTIAIVNTRMATPSQTHLQIFSSMGILTGSPSDPGAHRPFNPLNVKSCCKSDFFGGGSAWQQSPGLPRSEGASGLGRPSGMRLTRCLKVLPDGERTGILDKRNKRRLVPTLPSFYTAQKEGFEGAKDNTANPCSPGRTHKLQHYSSVVRLVRSQRETNFFGWCWGSQHRFFATDRVLNAELFGPNHEID